MLDRPNMPGWGRVAAVLDAFEDGPLTVACRPCGWERSRPNHAWAMRSLKRHGRRNHGQQVPTSWAEPTEQSDERIS